MSAFLIVFLIIFLGYIVGMIRIGGFRVGDAGVLLVALVFGHYGFTVPESIRDFGLIVFTTSVGLYSGPTFVRNIRGKALSFAAVGAVITLSCLLFCFLIIRGSGITAPLCAGILSGAMTSTPALASAIEATGEAIVSVGYGIAYPFGVLCVVLFVQLVPKLYRVDLTKIPLPAQPDAAAGASRDFRMADPLGLCSFALAALLGILLGSITIPLPGGASCSLGLAGGPLFAGLVVGHFGHVGPYSLRPQRITLDLLREGGMLLFLLSAGVEAGSGFVEVLQQYGFGLFLWGVVLTAVPMLLGFIVAHYLLKLDLRASLGAICGGMTSTPSLGTLLTLTREDQASSEAVSVAYAGAYPVALIILVIFVRFLVI